MRENSIPFVLFLNGGRQARIYGELLFKNGHARAIPLNYEIEGVDAKFKNLTDEEAYFGSETRGVCEIIKKVYYKNPKGEEFYSVDVRATGSPVKLAVLDLSIYPKIPGNGLHLVKGKLKTDIKRDYSKENGSREKAILDIEYVMSSPYQFGGSKTKEPA